MDEQEFTRLVRKFSGTVYRAAYCCLRDPADSDDITQDTFLALYTSDAEFCGDEHIKLFYDYTWGGKTMTLGFTRVYRYIPNSSEKDELSDYECEELLFGEDGLHVELPIDFPIFETKTWQLDKTVDLAANDINLRFTSV